MSHVGPGELPETNDAGTWPSAAANPVWQGSYVADALDVRIHSDPSSAVKVEDLVGLALRRNPKRAHLLVSTVLAKHIPTEPALVVAAGELLGAYVANALSSGSLRQGPSGVSSAPTVEHLSAAASTLTEALRSVGSERREAVAKLSKQVAAMHSELANGVVLGYAETATGLGRLVANSLSAYYLHSTRHATPGIATAAGFEEGHSHASSHRLVPTDANWLDGGGPVILVDDEISTGSTLINTIRELHQLAPRTEYVVAALIDLRSSADRARFGQLGEELGCSIEVVALGTGSIDLGEDILERAAGLISESTAAEDAGASGVAESAGRLTFLELSAQQVTPVRSDRFGNLCLPAAEDAGVIAQHLAQLADNLELQPPVTVVGTEEHMFLPLAVAANLAALRPELDVKFSTSTRSPIVAIAEPGYAVQSASTFLSHDHTIDGLGKRFAYNLGTAKHGSLVVFPEPGTAREALTTESAQFPELPPITNALQNIAKEVVVVQLPNDYPASEHTPVLPEPLHGPDFGSYPAADVSWLLKDLSHVQLEAPTADRERAIQSGKANYAESLPVEYTPTPEYQALYEEAAVESAQRIATAVGAVTELALAARGGAPVFVSLARAGTPIGILMRRWAARIHGIDAPHFTMSIVRGVGMDKTALRYLAAHFDPQRIVFVDGWTGKGAISKELAAALDDFEASDGVRFPGDLAVLADPGHCVEMYGTRDDFLIPSACLNSTVSGLVSRTVFNTDYIGPDDFHGAKFYAELAGSDVSNDFLDTVQQHFAQVSAEAVEQARILTESDRTPDWLGWRTVETISAEYGINNVNLVKPGVGETTRVLLRRVPWRVLVNPEAKADVAHVLLLAQQRGTTVEEVADLPYSCIGLIHPAFDKSAVGADGKAVPNA